MSFYADYLREKTGDYILETEDGFATYRFLNEKQVYIVDIFVTPAKRKSGIAAQMADKIAAEAIQYGCVEMVGTVVVSSNNSTESIKALIAYGMKINSVDGNMIILKKEL